LPGPRGEEDGDGDGDGEEDEADLGVFVTEKGFVLA